MISTAFSRVIIKGKHYLYVVKENNEERVYVLVKDSPCRTTPNCDEKLLHLLEDPIIQQAFINGVSIVVRRS